MRARIVELEKTREELERQHRNLLLVTEQLRTATDQANAANQAKSEFLAAMSHELRTPLAHIKGYVELLEEEELGELTLEQGKAMTVIGRATVRLGRLIEDLISFSTASREGMELNLDAVSLPAMGQELIDRSEP